MNITIDAATASILTGFIVGAVSIITTLIANGHSNRQQREQWEREEKRIQRAEIHAEKDKELSIKKELVNRLQDIYGNSIASLTALLIYDDDHLRLRPDYQENLKEAQKWLSQIIAIHYDKESTEYTHLLKLYETTVNSFTNYNKNSIENLRSIIITLISKDPRLII
jgi:hypothetical protein